MYIYMILYADRSDRYYPVMYARWFGRRHVADFPGGMPLDHLDPRCVPALTGMTRDVFRQLANMPGNSRQTTREKSADFGDKGVHQE